MWKTVQGHNRVTCPEGTYSRPASWGVTPMAALLAVVDAGAIDVLELDRLSVGYDRAPVVRDLTLTVGPGEVVALLGANGAGKTTTLRAISGLLKPASG